MTSATATAPMMTMIHSTAPRTQVGELSAAGSGRPDPRPSGPRWNEGMRGRGPCQSEVRSAVGSARPRPVWCGPEGPASRPGAGLAVAVEQPTGRLPPGQAELLGGLDDRRERPKAQQQPLEP